MEVIKILLDTRVEENAALGIGTSGPELARMTFEVVG
jgi:hypothetical protein